MRVQTGLRGQHRESHPRPPGALREHSTSRLAMTQPGLTDITTGHVVVIASTAPSFKSTIWKWAWHLAISENFLFEPLSQVLSV